MPGSRSIAPRLAALLGTALLSGCTAPPIDIAMVRVNGQLVARLSQDWGIVYSNREAPCVKVAVLFRQGTSLDEPVWKVEAAGGPECPRLDSLVIGTAPKGFQEVVRLPAEI